MVSCVVRKVHIVKNTRVLRVKYSFRGSRPFILLVLTTHIHLSKSRLTSVLDSATITTTPQILTALLPPPRGIRISTHSTPLRK